MSNFSDGIVSLPHLGVIRVAGDDSAKFLHAQLTQDFAQLDSGHARLAAFCNAKGRMLASFIGVRHGESEILLICSRDLLANTLKRLSMYVLRAKVRVTDASQDFAIFGLIGASASSVVVAHHAAWAVSHQESASLIQLYPADGQPRWLWIDEAHQPAPVGPRLSLDHWLWTEVRSGVATLTATVTELFVPQMLNYESVGGVNFKKGCYPGQEVIARSQFRGVIKRRAWLAHCAQPLPLAGDIFDTTNPGQPSGQIVQATASPHGGYDGIVSIQTSSVLGPGLRLGKPDGPVVELMPVPYPLLEDI